MEEKKSFGKVRMTPNLFGLSVIIVMLMIESFTIAGLTRQVSMLTELLLK